MSSDVVEGTLSKTRKAWSEQKWLAQLVKLLDHPRASLVALIVVLLLAAFFRFTGLGWDEGHRLHPDERFLMTVTNDLKWTPSFDTYFDPNKSTLSPYSLPNMGLYVYGTLPVYLVKAAAILLDRNTYDKLPLLARTLSGLFDLGAILFLFLIGRRLYGKKVGLLAALFLSLSVLNIQLSHFYTVDTFANLFVVATFYFLLRAVKSGRWVEYALVGLLLGLGIASKLSVLTLAAPILVGLGLDLYQRARAGVAPREVLEYTLVRFFTIVALAALTFRVIQPIAFSGPTFWDWSLNPRWLRDVADQQNLVTGQADVPWLQQWTDRPVTFALYNIVVWGMGVPLGIAGIAGLGLAFFELVKHRKLEHLLPVVFVLVTFAYHATQFVKFMRYFLPIYPFLALFAAYLLWWLWRRAQAMARPPRAPQSSGLERFRLSPTLALVLAVAVVGGTLLYVLAFSSIYGQPHSRIAATRWMYANIPAGAVLANEHWDDWLPVGGVDGISAYGENGRYKSVTMANYEDDTPAKLDQMVENLTKADYVVLSSNRLYDSIPRLPMRYPMTSRYYKLLFDGELGFDRVAEFTSYPTLLGIHIPDQAAEESFSVYDHPRVQVFKKTAAFDAAKVRKALGQGIVWEAVQHLTPLQATAAPQGLQLTPSEEQLYQQIAAWSSGAVNESSWGSQLPLLAWFIVLELIGLLALPLTLIVFKHLADRGYVLSKAIGLLVVAWGAWMLASLRLAPFFWLTLLAVMALFATSCLLISRERWRELWVFLNSHRRLVLLEEFLFWGLFAGFVLIRWLNPDLWHPGLGEKPMDLAYLNAIVHTPYFPAYDPWFAGGYINYYYFGFVLVAALEHLTGMVPYIAYNLAVPTFFAMTALGGFVAVFNFVQGQGNGRVSQRAALVAGLCGILFVALIGNLGQVQLLWDSVRNLSTIKPETFPSPLVGLAQFADGAAQWLGGHNPNVRLNWWYWNATRVIPPAPGESGPINEMPFFTFLFGDLHAHMMALPFTLLVLALTLNLVRESPQETFGNSIRDLLHNPSELLALGLLALTLGALYPLNTWDVPTYTVLAAAALACREYARRRKIDWAGVWTVAWRIVVVILAARILFLPFFATNANSYLGFQLWTGSMTPLWAYWIIHGLFLFVLVSYLIVELVSGQGHNALVRSARLHLKYWRKDRHVRQLFRRLAHPTRGLNLAVSLARVFFVFGIVVLFFSLVIGLVLGLASLVALLLFSPRPNARRQLLLCMIGLGLFLTAFVEVIVLKGDVSRMNTVFKFYLQVWVLWAVASAAALPQIAMYLRPVSRRVRASLPEPAEGSVWTPEVAAQYERQGAQSSLPWRRVWWAAFILLLAGCLLYPLTAAPARISDRFANSVARTLDGTAYMQTSVYNDEGRPIPLDWDRQALTWLRDNVHGIPTILEANTPLYRWGSRVSIYTGLPTVIGWDWHQKQQRSVLPAASIDRRKEDVRTLYTSTDLDATKRLLDYYGVRYIYLGALERMYYAGDGLGKFEREQGHLWDPVYHNDQVTIYQVR